MTKVWPVEGYFLMGVPAVEHDCDDPLCVESGAFTTKRQPPPKAKPASTETPPDGGVSDSED